MSFQRVWRSGNIVRVTFHSSNFHYKKKYEDYKKKYSLQRGPSTMTFQNWREHTEFGWTTFLNSQHWFLKRVTLSLVALQIKKISYDKNVLMTSETELNDFTSWEREIAIEEYFWGGLYNVS